MFPSSLSAKSQKAPKLKISTVAAKLKAWAHNSSEVSAQALFKTIWDLGASREFEHTRPDHLIIFLWFPSTSVAARNTETMFCCEAQELLMLMSYF